MSKKLVYNYEDMKRAGQLLNMVKISGVDNIRIMAELSMILDSGTVEDNEKGEMQHGNK